MFTQVRAISSVGGVSCAIVDAYAGIRIDVDHFEQSHYPVTNQSHHNPASQQCATSSGHGYPSNQGYPQNQENAQHFGTYPVHVSAANDRNPYQGNNDRTTDNSPATQSIFQTLLTGFVSNVGAPSTTTRRPPPIYTYVDQPVHDAPPRTRPATTTTTLTGTRALQHQVNTDPYNPFGNNIYTGPQQNVHAPSSNDREDGSFVYPSDGQSSNNAHDRNDFNDYGNQFTTQPTTRRTTRPPTTSTSATRTTTQSLVSETGPDFCSGECNILCSWIGYSTTGFE